MSADAFTKGGRENVVVEGTESRSLGSKRDNCSYLSGSLSCSPNGNWLEI